MIINQFDLNLNVFKLQRFFKKKSKCVRQRITKCEK